MNRFSVRNIAPLRVHLEVSRRVFLPHFLLVQTFIVIGDDELDFQEVPMNKNIASLLLVPFVFFVKSETCLVIKVLKYVLAFEIKLPS